MKPGWLISALLIIIMFLGGCAAGAYQAHEPEEEYSSHNQIPGSYYHHDTQLEQWYSPPYWMPDAN